MVRTAAIADGGIGGLVAAAALLRRGWQVEVHEQAPAFTEVGAGISVFGNALRALDAVGLGERVRAAGLGEAAGGFRDDRGRWLVRTGPGAAAGPLVMMHRAELLQVLLDALPPEVLRAGSPVSDVRISGAGATFAHPGGESTVDLLVGADGVRSAVRAAIWPTAPGPRCAGQTAWRMVLPAGGHAPAESSETWGPGQIFGIAPMSGDRLYCYAAAVAPQNAQGAGGERAELRRRFAGWPAPIPAVLAAVEPDAVLRHDLVHLPPLGEYARGPVALVGDAAHAMTPNLGQGGCQAMEDAVTLAAVLDGDEPVAAALRRYDELRRPRTQAIARRSLTSGRVSMLSARPAVAVRNTLLRLLPAPVLVRSMASVLDWEPPA